MLGKVCSNVDSEGERISQKKFMDIGDVLGTHWGCIGKELVTHWVRTGDALGTH